ncbi:MAG: 50S ribosomal protein L11 [Methanotrichaceae archaeon]
MANVVESLIPGGKASAGPPLGPALGPLGVNVADVVKKINKMTADLNGIQVPVKVTVKSRTEFEINVGTPPTAALILREAGVEKGAGDAEIVGNLTVEQAVKIVGIKRKDLLSTSLKNAVREIVGTCGSLGISIEGMPYKEAQAAIEEGKFDQALVETDA